MATPEELFMLILKDALDKYIIFLFSSSIEDFKLNQCQNFQLILRYFVNSIIFRVFHRLLCCVFIKNDFEK